MLTLVCARPSFKDVGLGQVCAVLGAREKGNTREVLIRGTLNKYVFVDMLKSQFDALIEEPEPPVEEEAETEAAADAQPSPPENSVSLAKVVDMLRDEDVQMVLARTGLPESQILKYEQVVEEAQVWHAGFVQYVTVSTTSLLASLRIWMKRSPATPGSSWQTRLSACGRRCG